MYIIKSGMVSLVTFNDRVLLLGTMEGLYNFHFDMKNCKRNFKSNGSLLQEEIISFCNGKTLPIQVFSAKEVMRMSEFTASKYCQWSSTFTVYQGVIDPNRPVYIKVFYELFTDVGMKGIIREIVIAAQMGIHQNNLKLLGCCLETDFPILIYEFPAKGCLADRIYRGEFSETWEMRLKIGYEIAYALSYIQNAFDRPVIHRNLTARDVFLDENYVAKISGFHFSVLIPKGEDHLMDAIVGTNGYSAPEYINSGRLTVKTDVFLFGMLFLGLLAIPHLPHKVFTLSKLLCMSKDDLREGIMDKVFDPRLLKEVNENEKQHELQEVLDLIIGCFAREDDRPNIVDVAVALKKFVDSS